MLGSVLGFGYKEVGVVYRVFISYYNIGII